METFYRENTTWPYEAKLDYRCPPGKAFELQDGSGSFVNSITVECGWDMLWTWNPPTTNGQLLPCKYTHCTQPLTPPEATGLVPDWNGGLVDFHSDIEYKCSRGQKFFDNFGKTSQKSTCQPENVWTQVSWGQCVETKTCTIPPLPPDGGSVTVHSEGYMYGRNCSTGGEYVSIPPISGGGCGTPQITQMDSKLVGSNIESKYKITIEKNPPGGSAALLLTFSQPVDVTSVVITGSVSNFFQLNYEDTSNILSPGNLKCRPI